ncbi:MAG TPA: hypothetical protein VGC03_17420 [Acidimicrobiia bacterium]
MTPGRGVLVIGLALVLVACGVTTSTTSTAGAGQTSTTSSLDSGSTTATSITVTTTISEPALSDLTGNWENGTLILQVNDAGEFLVLNPEDPEQPLMGGFVARDGTEFNFVTGTSGQCPGQTGVYETAIDGDTLRLTLIDDPCETRSAGFADEFTSSG